MKRFAAFLLGTLYGLLLTWVFLYTYSNIKWPEIQSNSPHGCRELDKCAIPWWEGALLLSYLLAPALLFGLLNAIAYKRWSRQKWAISLSIGTMLVSLLYLETYVARLF
ncbi:hypothetical protein [Burkholderia ubonensis]|uniref:hypothetical protein n=1 Tax=Burkholderia ubonensis TaxID=101571 RepID=UPI0008FE2E0D|nr:hypothetical protein [Burkholderia ubonensis]